MKLNEIFNVEPANDLENDNSTKLGQGTYATVSQSSSDPHMVNRITNKSNRLFDEDAFEIYASHIIRDKVAEENPTFPRIYKKSNGKYQIEKLIPLDKIEDEELFNYIINNFNYEYEMDARELKENLDNGNIILVLVNFIHEALWENESILINNKYIRAACKYITRLARISGKHIDIHDGNIMFRRTPVGIQLVLTDPIQ